MAFAGRILLLIITSIFFSLDCVSYAQNDTLKQGQLLRDYEQLVSAGGMFKLGFFNPNPSTFPVDSAGPRYLGIWFEQIPIYSVWVANRESPVHDSSGALIIDGDGNLKITYQKGEPIVISSNIQASNSSTGKITATLLDSGNLVLRQVGSDGIAGPVLWQSFDYPHNVLLPGMKLGVNLKTGLNWSMTSWLSEKIPAAGAFRMGLDPSGANQLLVWRREEIYWSSGVWKNGSFQSAPELTKRSDIYDFKFVINEHEKYFSYSIKEKSILSKWDVDTIGQITVFTLDRRASPEHWIFETSGPCQSDAKNSSSLCLTEKPNKCRNGSESFAPKRGYLLNGNTWFYDSGMSLSLSDCHAQCWKNCSCMAYQYIPSAGTGCQFWGKGTEFRADDTFEFLYLLKEQYV